MLTPSEIDSFSRGGIEVEGTTSRGTPLHRSHHYPRSIREASELELPINDMQLALEALFNPKTFLRLRFASPLGVNVSRARIVTQAGTSLITAVRQARTDTIVMHEMTLQNGIAGNQSRGISLRSADEIKVRVATPLEENLRLLQFCRLSADPFSRLGKLEEAISEPRTQVEAPNAGSSFSLGRLTLTWGRPQQ